MEVNRQGVPYRVRGADEAYPAVAHALLLGSRGAAVRALGTPHSEDVGRTEWELVERGEVWSGAGAGECQWRQFEELECG